MLAPHWRHTIVCSSCLCCVAFICSLRKVELGRLPAMGHAQVTGVRLELRKFLIDCNDVSNEAGLATVRCARCACCASLLVRRASLSSCRRSISCVRINAPAHIHIARYRSCLLQALALGPQLAGL